MVNIATGRHPRTTWLGCLPMVVNLLQPSFALVYQRRYSVASSTPNVGRRSDGSVLAGERALGTRAEPPLVPRAGARSFKILQLADAHLGEDLGGDWGPRQDRSTLEVINRLLDEEQPDLVVFSGDQITGENVLKLSDRERLLGELEEPLVSRGIPWATVFGNHDACDMPGCKVSGIAATGRISAATLAVGPPAGIRDVDGTVELGRVDPSGTDASIPTSSESTLPPSSGTIAFPSSEDVEAAHRELVGSMHRTVVDVLNGRQREQAPKAASAPVASIVAAPSPATMARNTSAIQASQTAVVQNVAADGAQVAGPHVHRASSSKDVVNSMPVLVGASSRVLASEHVATSRVTSMSRHDWRRKYLEHEIASSLSRTGADGVFQSKGGGLSNYHLKVFSSLADAQADHPSFILWFMDTGGGDSPEALNPDQIEWMREESGRLTLKYGPVPGALYTHVPLHEYVYAKPESYSKACSGVSDDYVTALPTSPPVFPLLSDMHVGWVFSGHNHGNDWCCRVRTSSSPSRNRTQIQKRDVQLCYGRHSGYGGYSTRGLHLRGARVFEIQLPPYGRPLHGLTSAPTTESWVRLEDGTKGVHWSEPAVS